MRLATTNIRGVDISSVSLLRDGKFETAVFTDPETIEIDSVQYKEGLGPCLDAVRRLELMRIPSTPDDEQWPAFSRAAAAHGVLSTLAVPFIVRGQGTGALNLYSRAARNFSQQDEEIGRRFSEQASVALANAQIYGSASKLIRELNEALSSRAVIDQAKGIIMTTSHVDADRAFELLKDQSQHENRKLRDVAQELVDRHGRRSAR